MLEDKEKDVFISEDLRYFSLTNIFFDSPIKEEEIQQLKEIFFSINNINQIYFQKSADIKTIEFIKYLLEISPTMDDSMVEKYILNTESLDKKKLLDINFSNPESWQISYKSYDKEYEILPFDKYRELESIISKVISDLDDNFSQLEKIATVYDFCKELDYSEDRKFDLYTILNDKVSNDFGFSYVFSAMLSRLGINNFIVDTIVDNKKSSVVIASVDDSKYSVRGIYLFDPLSDYIPRNDLSDRKLRNINYNYFGIRMIDFTDTVFSDKFSGVGSCLIHDDEYDLEKLKYISPREVSRLEDAFNDEFFNIHQKISDTKKIEDDIKLEIIRNVNDKDYYEVIKENYFLREEKIFKSLSNIKSAI